MAADLFAAKRQLEADGGLGKSQLQAKFMEKYLNGLRQRAVREREWYIGKEFLRGNHYTFWQEGRGVVNPVLDQKFLLRPRLVWNKIRIDTETILSYLLRTDPNFSVTPNTGDWEDQAASEIATRVHLAYWQQLQLYDKLEETGYWVYSASHGIWKTTWDPLAGPEIPIYKEQPPSASMPVPEDGTNDGLGGGQPSGPNSNDTSSPTVPQAPPGDMQSAPANMPNMPGMPQIPGLIVPPPMPQVERVIPGGDVRVDLISPFEFIVDPGATTIEEAAWAIHATMRPIDELKALYPEHADQIRADYPDVHVGYANRTLQSFGLVGSAYQTPQHLNRKLILECWAKPTKEFPNGLRMVMGKDYALEVGPTPRGHASIPFDIWHDKRVPGEFYGDATVRDAIPLQKELNKRVNQAIEVANKFKSKWVAVRGSLDEKQLNNETGEVLEHEAGQRPTQEHPPPIPPILKDLIQLTADAIDDTYGITSVLQGKEQGERPSGRNTAYLGGYSESRLNIQARHLAYFLKGAGKKLLTLVAENVTDKRLAQVSGRNRQMESFYFKGADIRGNTALTVDVGSMLGFSRQERFDKLVQLQQQQIITNEQFLDNLGMEDFYPLIEAKAQDRNVALKENAMWKQMQPVRAPFYFEDDEVHLVIHNNFRKSAIYEQIDPMFRQQIDLHCQVHEERLQSRLGLGGMPPPPAGGPAGPGAPIGGPGPNLTNAPSILSGANSAESGAETAEGLPPVPAVPDITGGQ